MVYLDNAATTKPKEEVIKVINDSMQNDWCNPSSLYKPAYKVADKIKEARKIIADSIGAKPEEIYFTSGGGEGNNMILQGYQYPYLKGDAFISAVEHKSITSIYNTAKHVIGVQENGYVNLKELESELESYRKQHFGDDPLVSIQYVNNETGVIQDIKAISKIVHKYNGIFHTDAVQAFPHHNINVVKQGIDMMTVSGHKFGCPKGIGFVYIKEKYRNRINPLINGSQERGMRGGTENVPYILGLAKAVQCRTLVGRDTLIVDELTGKSFENAGTAQHYFEGRLKELGCTINCENSKRVETIISCTLPEGILGELLMFYLGFEDIYVSTGSACNSKSNQPSYVLEALGLSDNEINRTIRISFDFDITFKDIDNVISVMKKYIIKR